jgi:hypothetical protein
MKPLTQDQIDAVIEWMNCWGQLKETVIPMRFKEDFKCTNVSNSCGESCQNHNVERPPLGLKPKWIHDKQRQVEILKAINRYLSAGKTPPKEWAIEFASYCG